MTITPKQIGRLNLKMIKSGAFNKNELRWVMCPITVLCCALVCLSLFVSGWRGSVPGFPLLVPDGTHCCSQPSEKYSLQDIRNIHFQLEKYSLNKKRNIVSHNGPLLPPRRLTMLLKGHFPIPMTILTLDSQDWKKPR